MNRLLKPLLIGIIGCFLGVVFVQCTPSAEEYKAQAVKYAENGERAKAAEAYLKAAEMGDAESQFVIGCLYTMGNDIPNNPYALDINVGLTWFEKSANQNNDMALLMLGKYYAEIKNDKDKAVEYWEKSAENGNYMAKFMLGMEYLSDNATSDELHKAESYLTEASDGGSIAAICMLSYAYMSYDFGPDKFLLGYRLSQDMKRIAENSGIDIYDLESVLKYDYVELSKSKNINI